MSTVFTILLIMAGAATHGALVWGLIAMARGGEFNAQWSNKMMRYRVLFQAIAIGVLALLVTLSGR